MSKYKPMVTKYTNSLIYEIEEWLENTNKSQEIFDTLDICHLIGKIQYQQKEIERLNNIINGIEKFFEYEYDNEVRTLNDRKISVWTICLDKLKELKEKSNDNES